MAYPEAAWERAMKVQEVIMKALTGELDWYRAADILGFSPRVRPAWIVPLRAVRARRGPMGQQTHCDLWPRVSTQTVATLEFIQMPSDRVFHLFDSSGNW
jgi:hypothetical protein